MSSRKQLPAAVPVGYKAGKESDARVVAEGDEGAAGEAVVSRSPRAFTTGSRGGQSWVEQGGYSLRAQAEARRAAARERGGESPLPARAVAAPVEAPLPSPEPVKKGSAVRSPSLPQPKRERVEVALPAPGSVVPGEEVVAGEGAAPKLAVVDDEPVLPSPVLPQSRVDEPVLPGLTRAPRVEVVEPEPEPEGVEPEVVPVAPTLPTRGRLESHLRRPVSTPGQFVQADSDWDAAEDDVALERKERALDDVAARGLRLTGRDVEIIRFLARYRYAAHHQVARYVGTSEKAASIRLHKLAAAKLMAKKEITHGRSVWTPTKNALAIADVDLPAVRVSDISFSTMAHELGLVNLGIELEIGGENVLEEDEWPKYNRIDEDAEYSDDDDDPDRPAGRLPGERVLTTRQIRSGQARWRKDVPREEIMREYEQRMRDWRPGDPSPELLPGNEGMFLMYHDEYGDHPPDMVVMRDRADDGSPGSIAIELELSHKPERELIRILKNFKESVLFDKLYYFCHKKSVAMSLVRVNEREVGIPESKFRVMRYVPTKSKDPFWG